MKKVILPVLLLAACGGKHSTTTTTPNNSGGDQYGGVEGGMSGGDMYGGDMYGDEYGYGEYGDGMYGGGEYGGYDGYTPPAPTAPEISGKWASACTPTGTKSEFRKMTFENTADAWDLHVESFGDAACTKRASDLHLAGAYTIGAASAGVAGAWEGTFTFATREITADDAKTAKAIGKLCGIKKLKAKTATSIHDKGCVAIGVKPAAQCSTDNDVVAIQGDKLRFGVRPADNDLCTADKRPTALDTSLDLQYQWKSTGIAECDAMMQTFPKYINCSKLPAETQTQVFVGFRQAEGEYAKFATLPADQKASMASGCTQATQALSQSLTSLGC